MQAKNLSGFKVERISFQLGMINCFVEMVACGVKKLALSPPLSPEDYETISPLSDKIVKSFHLKSHLEKSLMVTDLQTDDFTRGKWNFLYYEDESVLQAYIKLKKKKAALEESGHYDTEARKDISREFMRLLSYPENKIKEKIARKIPESPFMLTDD